MFEQYKKASQGTKILALLCLGLLLITVWTLFLKIDRAEIYICNYNIPAGYNPVGSDPVKPVCEYQGRQYIEHKNLEEYTQTKRVSPNETV